MVGEREDSHDGWAKELKTIEYSIEDEEDSNARARFKLGVENQAEATEENLAFEMDQVQLRELSDTLEEIQTNVDSFQDKS